MNEERKVLHREIKEYFTSSDSDTKDMPLEKMERYMELVSKDISEAIGGTDPVNAPFIIMILEQYAEGLRKTFQGSDEIISVLKLICRKEEITIMMPSEPFAKEEKDV